MAKYKSEKEKARIRKYWRNAGYDYVRVHEDLETHGKKESWMPYELIEGTKATKRRMDALRPDKSKL